MKTGASQKRRPVLDPVDRASEVIFGVLMAMSFTGSLSVATAARDEVNTMLVAALGCNLAWGATDAVMYLVGTLTERRRKVHLFQRLRDVDDEQEAARLIAAELPDSLAEGSDPSILERLRRRLRALPVPAAGLAADDYAGAVAVFLLVAASTFPVVLPFLLTADAELALRASNALAVATLAAAGATLGRYAGGVAWRWGLGMAGVGVVLVSLILALGG